MISDLQPHFEKKYRFQSSQVRDIACLKVFESIPWKVRLYNLKLKIFICHFVTQPYHFLLDSRTGGAKAKIKCNQKTFEQY